MGLSNWKMAWSRLVTPSGEGGYSNPALLYLCGTEEINIYYCSHASNIYQILTVFLTSQVYFGMIYL